LCNFAKLNKIIEIAIRKNNVSEKAFDVPVSMLRGSKIKKGP
jgi:hypothetical protein